LSNKQVLVSRPLPVPGYKEVSTEDEAVEKGRYLGETNESGELITTFDDPGHYRIVARKQGYTSGSTHIMVYSEAVPKVLAVKGPYFAKVDEEVTFTILERYDGSVVEGADVYALPMSFRRDITDEEKKPSLEPSPGGKTETSLQTRAVKHGIHIGTTDQDGQVTHAFTEPGRYLIVATGEGYIPGTSRISIGSLKLSPAPIPKSEGKEEIKLYPSSIRPVP